MTRISSSLPVICRPARRQDLADVTEFCKGIWDGDDYVPEVWEDWVSDHHGLLVVAENDGHAIGCSKITMLSRGQWWLEGFRVDPKYQGLKVGSQIHKYAVEWWLKHGDGILRLMTDAGNFAVHHVCVKTGFTKTHEVCAYNAPPLNEPTDHFSPITDTHEAAAFALASESIHTTRGLSDFGWRICKPDEHAVKGYSTDRSDYLHTFSWWKNKQGLFSFWENQDDAKRILVIGVIACALQDLPVLLIDVRRFAAQKGFDLVFQIAFDTPQIISQLLTAGFEKRWKRSNAFVFERNHPAHT